MSDSTSSEPNQSNSDEKLESTADTPPPAAPIKASKNRALWALCLINFLAIITIIAGIYWYYTQIREEENNFDESFSELQKQLTQIETKVKQSTKDLIEQNNTTQQKQADAIKALETLISENKSVQDANSRKLAELSGRRPSDWLLAEANFLVSLAGRKLYLEQDIDTAITLLVEADARIQELKDPSLLPLRAEISKDIQVLSSITPKPINSMALQLNAIMGQVDELPLDYLQLPDTEAPQDLTLSDDVNDWQSNLAKTWRSIVGDFISIKKVNAPLEPYLAERQQWLIKEQFKHALSRAQSALLSDDIALYQAQIHDALALVSEHFQENDPQVINVSEQLAELSTDIASTKLPDSLKSYGVIKDLIEQRVSLLISQPEENVSPEDTATDSNDQDDDL